MRGICQLSLRWHQQFARSAQLTGHQRCLQSLQPVRFYRQRSRTLPPVTSQKPRNDGLVVREYEQFGKDVGTRVPDTSRAEMQDQAKFLQSKIKELEEELADMKGGPFGPNSEFIQSLPVDEREQMLRTLEEEGLLEEDDEDILDTKEMDAILEEGMPDEVGGASLAIPAVTLRIPQQQKNYVKRFNQALKTAVESDQAIEERLTLWKWYLRCQQHVMGFSNIISEDVWQTLWDSQSKIFYRPQYVVMLARDMQSAKVTLSPTQWITYIQALRQTGDLAVAVQAWEEQRPALGPDPEWASEYYTLGVDLFCDLGRPQTAQELVKECLDHSTVISPRIYIPLISAWAKSQNTLAPQNAWVCYLRLKAELGEQMTADIYATISQKLLDSGRRDMALAVFKDLMLAMEPSRHDSMAVFDQLLGLTKRLQPQTITPAQIDEVALKALLVFPKKLNNKFFFGAWMKQLIGTGNVSSAADVVELMYERGVKLDAKHLNGLVAGWLRKGSKADQDKAEKLAWSMIHRRLDVVQEHERQHVPRLPTGTAGTELAWHKSRIPAFLRRAAPAANIETFSILLQHYTRRSKMESAEYLTELMSGPAQIKANSFIMNHWLYASLRQGDLAGVWTKYSALKAEIKPDLETFAALWDAGKVRYDPARHKKGKGRGFPHAKTVWREMGDWLASLDTKNAEKAKAEFSRELYDQITRCFCLCEDLPGVLCALHGMRGLFGEYPDDVATQMVILKVAQMMPREELKPSTWKSRRRMIWEKKGLERVLEIFETIEGGRLMGMGVERGELSEGEKGRVRLESLTEFLLGVMGKLNVVEGGMGVAGEVGRAAEIMGLQPYMEKVVVGADG